MSEEATAFARRSDPSDPFPIVPDEVADTAADGGAMREPEPDPDPGSETWNEPVRDTVEPQTPAEPIDTVLAANERLFLGALIAALAGKAQGGDGDGAVVGIALSRLGQAFADGHDESAAFQALVDALDRRRFGEPELRTVSPVVTAFFARIVGARYWREAPAADPVGLGTMVEAAAQLVDAALETGGGRAWRRLPEIAATIARRAAHRDLSLNELTEALPRLAARFAPEPRETAARDGVGSITDHPRDDFARGGAAEEPRRMVISGPVEIVILDR